MKQNECSCSHCYHGVCFHPMRGDGAGLGTPCDGCDFDSKTASTQDYGAPESDKDFDHQAPIMTMMLLTGLKR